MFLVASSSAAMPQFFSPLLFPCRLFLLFLCIPSSCLLLSICPKLQFRSADGVLVPTFIFRTSLDLLARLSVPVTVAMGSLSGCPFVGADRSLAPALSPVTGPLPSLYIPHTFFFSTCLFVHWSPSKLEQFEDVQGPRQRRPAPSFFTDFHLPASPPPHPPLIDYRFNSGSLSLFGREYLFSPPGQ